MAGCSRGLGVRALGAARRVIRFYDGLDSAARRLVNLWLGALGGHKQVEGCGTGAIWRV